MTRRSRRRLQGAGVFVCGLVLAALAAWIAYGSVLSSARADIVRQARAALALQARTVESVLGKYRHLPAQLAHRAEVRRLFENGAAARVGVEVATDVAGLSGASDIAFLDPIGRPVGAAFEEIASLDSGTRARIVAGPREGRLGRTIVLPVRAGEAASYVFSYPVRSRGMVVGATAVLVDLARIEETWALSLDTIRATDAAGRPIVANDREVNEPSLTVSRLLPQVGWTLEIERDAAPAHAAARNAAGLATLVILALTALLLAWMWRRDALNVEVRRQRAAALVLERRVRDRTKELEAAQAELVQSAKLAALGRMSAALAHEYAQPLAAIRTYAENARTLIERDRPADVPPTLERVTAMTDRMRALSQTLRSFAREPGTALRPTSLEEAFEDARLLVEPQARAKGVSIVTEGTVQSPVMGGRVRLSQVLLNLLTNAVEASPEGGTVRVLFAEEGDRTSVRVADEGEGVPPSIRGAIFDPFFTTRPVGEGLGLGLAIAYNVARDFGGSLRLLEREGGAVFELLLQSADMQKVAA